MILPRVLVKQLRSSKKPWIIIFSSFVHGSGKSTLSKMIKSCFARNKIRVYRLYTGEIFRRIAVSNRKTIEEFLHEIENNLELDFEFDEKVWCFLKNLRKKNYYQCIIVDSSVAPYYLYGSRVVKVYVYSSLRFVAHRLIRLKRIGDSEFSDEKDVINKLLERSIEDYKRYKKLARFVSDEFWKKVYSSYGKQVFDLRHDNSISLEISFRKLLTELAYTIKAKLHKLK